MSEHKRKALPSFAAVVIPAGIAAAVVFQAPVANAAPALSLRPGTAEGPQRILRLHISRLAGSAHHQEARRLRAYAWAAAQKGHPYIWGGTGPGYDCSGLVMMAYRRAGIRLPRTTTGMLASRLLIRVRHPRMGDLAFYGSGHVELFRRWGYTFGAHDTGSLVGLVHYGWGWKPTAFYRVR